jgi:hypothetical protein
MTQDMEKKLILQMGSNKMIGRHVCDKPFTIRYPDRSEWKKGFQPDGKGGLIWYTDISMAKKGTGTGVYCHGTRKKLSFSLGQYTTVFQTEVYVIKTYTVQNLHRDSKNRNSYILSDSQAAIKALGQHQITSKLVWVCHQSLKQLDRQSSTDMGATS